MFRTLKYPSSGACDCVVELPHRSSCSQFVVCWRFGAAGFEWCLFCRLKPADRSWGPPSLLYNGYRVFPGGKERPRRYADPSPLLVPWSSKSKAIPLLPLWAVGLYRASVPVQGCTSYIYIYTYIFYLFKSYLMTLPVNMASS